MAGNSQEKLECDLKANVEDRFATKVLSNLHELMKNGEFCDVVLHVDNDNFTVHKAVLVSSSAYFRAMFCDDMSEKHQAEVSKACFILCCTEYQSIQLAFIPRSKSERNVFQGQKAH